jgi:RimJ/RimL family protein N-acetyltransferase
MQEDRNAMPELNADASNRFVLNHSSPAISDGAVMLDDFRQSDASTIFSSDSDFEHRRRFDFPDDFVPSLEHSQHVISKWMSDKIAGRSWTLAIRESETGDLLGGCELRPQTHETTNLSYWVYPAHRSKGIGSRAVALVCEIAFQHLAFNQIDLLIDPDNFNSQRIAERNGFAHVGTRDRRLLFIKKSTQGA